MIAYIKCTSCGVQWSFESNNISLKACKHCGQHGHQVSIGSRKPDWYIGPPPGQEQVQTQKQKRWWEFWK